jgi:oxalate decarboxylase/phosphoglucose isomerase-like protein (cupin superfamily)
MYIEYHEDPSADRPEAVVDRFEEIVPERRHQADPGANADYMLWTFPQEGSRWFQQTQLYRLEPGEHTAFQAHLESVEGPMERCIRIFGGEGVLRTEFWDEPLECNDLVIVPAGAAYQLGNPGTEPLWVADVGSVGDNELQAESWLEPHERPGYEGEFARIMAARAARDLSTEVDDPGYDGDPDDGRTAPEVYHFAETQPTRFAEAPQTGSNSNRRDWISTVEAGDWFPQNAIQRLEPGEYVSMHAHFENEGPYEENYWVLDGRARLQTEYWDATLEKFDCAFFPTGCAHNFGNAGTEPMWFVAWVSRGGVGADFEINEVETGDRPGLEEDYRRVMAARKQRGLPVHPHVEVDLGDE